MKSIIEMRPHKHLLMMNGVYCFDGNKNDLTPNYTFI